MQMDGGMPITFSRNRNEQLADEITQLAGQINAASHQWLKLLAEFDNRNGWSDWATQSCAHWLNWKCGIDLGAAREKVRVAHALEALPKISAAMSTGELSYSKVRALTRIATTATEDYLLMIALHGTAHHVEKLVRSYRRVIEAQELSRDEAQQANRSVTYHYDNDGSLILNARLPAEVGALLVKALDLGMEELSTDVSAETSEASAKKPTRSMKRADALANVAESFLAHGAKELSGGDKHQIVVHVSAETLQHKEAGCCEFEDGPAIASETARRLACDCSVVRIVEDEEGNPLDVGRKTRSIPPALQRALNSRDKGCRFPGCCNIKWTHAHHIEHWANGGETKLKNLVTLCRFHHRLVHEGGVQIQVLNDGAFRFLKPNGESIEGVRKKVYCSSPITLHSSRPRSWNGDSMDYGLAVQGLMQKEARAESVLRSLSAQS
jgi:hypothetical protein